MKFTKTQREEAVIHLREYLKPGDTLYTVLRHVSRSGMMRRISVYTIRDNEPRFLDWYTAATIGSTLPDRGDGVRMDGCGMDMGFALVYEVSAAIFRDGFICIGDGCPANDHFNGDRDFTPHNHRDGGYALTHRWM